MSSADRPGAGIIGGGLDTRAMTQATISERTVLLVEDDEELRGVLGRGLREEGFSVDSASTGANALEAVERSMPDVLVIDIGLPDADGRDLCQALRARGVADAGALPDRP